jgi:uncharacterized membrane protein YjjP (DUF1212 family)
VSAVDGRQLSRFLVGLGSGMTAAGDSVTTSRARLRRVADAYGATDARISVLPTFLVVVLGPGDPTAIERTNTRDGALRLDQTAALFELVKAAEGRELEPAEGLRRLATIGASEPRFGGALSLLGHLVVTVGVCLILQPTWTDVAAAAGLGAVVGLLAAAPGHRETTGRSCRSPPPSRSRRSASRSLATAGWTRTCAR